MAQDAEAYCECGTLMRDVVFIKGTERCTACSELAEMTTSGASNQARIRCNDDGITPTKLNAAYREFRA